MDSVEDRDTGWLTTRDLAEPKEAAFQSLGQTWEGFKAALEEEGISRIHPGFDILTILSGAPDRLIEIKSSGVDARVQTMTWNDVLEVGAGVHEICAQVADQVQPEEPTEFASAGDPFGSLMSETITERNLRRAVQLRVRELEKAEHLDLMVETQTDTDEGAGGGD